MRQRLGFFLTMTLALACGAEDGSQRTTEVTAEQDGFEMDRERMVVEQIEERGVSDPRVLAALRKVPRHLLVAEELRTSAYLDHPLPIGDGQTISQPYIVARMSELLEIEPGDRVLEIGTGSGYQAAVLAEMGAVVWTIEIVESLADSAAVALATLGYDQVTVRHGDGYVGWPDEAPFDAIIITAAPPAIPKPLIEQLAVGAHLVTPVGEQRQRLVRLTRTEEGITSEELIPVVFVPMTGEAQKVHQE